LTSPATDKDVLLTTHSYHTDHYNKPFATSFPGKQLLDMEARIAGHKPSRR